MRTLGGLAGQQPWHRPPGTGRLAAELDGERGPDPGCRDRMATRCRQSSPRHAALHTVALFGGRSSPGVSGPAWGLLPGDGNDHRLPTRVTGRTTLTASPVTSAVVTPAPGGPTSQSLEQGLGVGMCISHSEQVEAEPWVDPVGSTCCPGPAFLLPGLGGPLPRSGQGQGCPAEPRQALQT